MMAAQVKKGHTVVKKDKHTDLFLLLSSPLCHRVGGECNCNSFGVFFFYFLRLSHPMD